MPNYLNMLKRQQVISLLELGWSYRRVEAETGVRRETVSGYDRSRRSNAAKVFPGSETPALDGEAGSTDPVGANAAKVFPGRVLPARSSAACHHDTIVAKLEQRLSSQRIWQDLVADYGYGFSYESVKRYVRGLKQSRRIVGVFHSAPGDEAQVDFFQGAPTLHTATGQWGRPWVFRMTLCCSRHGYEEAVWDQKIEGFLRLHENAFRDLGGVPRSIRHDNLKAAVVRACYFDPEVNVIYAAFAEHWGFTPLPTRPRYPQENGKQERSGGYVKDNALKGRRFDSLDECNGHLRHWNRTIARLRIHGTTRRQVWTHFVEVEQPALGPLAPEAFPFFDSGVRSVHPDGHVEVRGSFYPAPAHLLGKKVQVRWDRNLVRLYHEQVLVGVHARVAAGLYAPRPGQPASPETSSQRAFIAHLLGRCSKIGPELHDWAEEAIEVRGVRALRLIQGVIGLTRSHPKEHVLHAARTARVRGAFRYKDLRRLAEGSSAHRAVRRLLDVHPSIRPMSHYRLEDLS